MRASSLIVPIVLGLSLAGCADVADPYDDSAAGFDAYADEKYPTGTEEYCDGQDNDGDTIVDEDCGQCDYFVSRTKNYWKLTSTACVVQGSATGYSLLPVSVGATTYSTAGALRMFIAGTSTGNPRKALGQEIATAKLNAAAFRTGDLPYYDYSGDSDRETVNELLVSADALYVSGTTSARNAMKAILVNFNGEGATLGTWFDTTCVQPPEICDGLDNDSDGTTDESCGCYEVCDGVDNDANGLVDEGGDDLDADGYGCDDCDDADAAVNPGALEVSNGIDDDCNGLVDDGVDGDGDGYPVEDDCNDGNAAIYPGANEVINGVDDDCDGLVDEPVVVDTDGDGFLAGADCNDSNAAIHPGASEIVANGIDEDCDTFDSCYTDADNDGYGTSVVVDGSSLSCVSGSGAAFPGDCNDGSSSISPIGFEIRGDGIDQDCSGADLAYTYTLSGDVQAIFNSKCTTGCHSGGAPSAGMSLSSGSAYGEIVNVLSGEATTRDIVEPGASGSSYMINKLNNTQATVGGSGVRMPKGGAALSSTDIGKISVWIDEGAPNN